MRAFEELTALSRIGRLRRPAARAAGSLFGFIEPCGRLTGRRHDTGSARAADRRAGANPPRQHRNDEVRKGLCRAYLVGFRRV